MPNYLVEGQPPEIDYLVEYSIQAPNLESAVEFARTNYLLRVTRVREQSAETYLRKENTATLAPFPTVFIFWTRLLLGLSASVSVLIAFFGALTSPAAFIPAVAIGLLFFVISVSFLAVLRILEAIDLHSRITVLALYHRVNTGP